MKKLIFPGTRRLMLPHQGFDFLRWTTRNPLSGCAWVRTLGDGWWQGCCTTAPQVACEPNQPLTGNAVYGPVCSCFSDPVTLRLDVAGESLSSLFLSSPLCHIPLRQLSFCSSSLSPARPPCSILGLFILLYDDIPYLSSWNFGVVMLAPLPEGKMCLQVANAPRTPQRPSSRFWSCLPLLRAR